MAVTNKKKAKSTTPSKTAQKTRSGNVSNAAKVKKARNDANKNNKENPSKRAPKKKTSTPNTVQAEGGRNSPDYEGYDYGRDDSAGVSEDRGDDEDRSIQLALVTTQGQQATSTSLTEPRGDLSNSTPLPIDFELQVEDLRNEAQRKSNQNARLTDQNKQLNEELDKRIAEHGATRQVGWKWPPPLLLTVI